MSNWHSVEIKEVERELETDSSNGLTSDKAKEHLAKYGMNKIAEEKKLTFFSVAFKEIREPMILLLLVVGIVYSIWGEIQDALTIFTIIFILVFVEVYTEFKAKKSILALKKLTEPNVTVLRDSNYRDIPVSELVPGDVIILRVGQRLPADARIVEAYGLMADESTLTGESAPVEKEVSVLAENKQVTERKNMVFAGSIITKGKGKAIVCATGMKTELGIIAKMVSEAKIVKTPLQRLMKELTKWMVWVALFFSVLIPLIGYFRGQPWKEMILTGLALSFATIPEELPIVITMVLALGAFALSKKHALVKKLDAAETLGSVTVICSDKTGTLTENRMEVSKIFLNSKIDDFDHDKKEFRPALEAAALCSDVLVKDDNVFMGDPMQVALLKVAIRSRIDIPKLKEKYGQLVNEFSFDSKKKMMSVVCSKGYVFVSGAPEILFEKCTDILDNGREKKILLSDRRAMQEATESMTSKSLRIIAYAFKKAKTDVDQKNAESKLTFIGMFGLADPLRKDVKEAVMECRDAGIRVIMLTGDHVDTAKAIAKEAGIDNELVVTGTELDKIDDEKLAKAVSRVSVYARVSPEHKLRILNALKKNGEIVAVTGDGINDAPALSNAHIGIAMGETGTDVAREASSMILTDDNFATITNAVREGRKIFDNLKKGIRYYLCVKLALIFIFLLPILFGVALPFAPVQIILLELFMDLAASTGFAIEPAESNLMKRKPRDAKEKFLNENMIGSIFIGAICLIAAVLFAYFWSLNNGVSIEKAKTIAFATWILGHVFLAVNMRSEKEPIYKLGVFSNKVIVIWAVAAIGVMILAVNIPYFQEVLKTVSLGLYDWLLIVITAFVATFWLEIVKIVRKQ